MWTARFWRQALERALKSAAQALILLWGADSLNVVTIDWPGAAGIAAGAVVLSLLTSIVSAPAGEPGTPSLTR